MKSVKKRIFRTDSAGNLEVTEIVEKSKREDRYEAFRYLGLGYYILVPLLIALIAGVGADRLLGTKPVFSLIGILLGSVATFYNLFKLTRDGEGTAH